MSIEVSIGDPLQQVRAMIYPYQEGYFVGQRATDLLMRITTTKMVEVAWADFIS